MPYCVNCGVELSGSEEKCPLCGTEVYRPKSAAKGGPPDARPYPPYQPLTIQRVSKSSIIILITLLSLLPVLLTLICDLSINRGVTWSAYAAASVAFSLSLYRAASAREKAPSRILPDRGCLRADFSSAVH